MKRKLIAAIFASMSLAVFVTACNKKGPDGVQECEDLKKLVAGCKGPNKGTYDETLKGNWETWKEVDQKSLKETCKQVGDSWKEFCK